MVKRYRKTRIVSTKLQKQREFVINQFGTSLVIDHWGNYKKDNYRIKLKRTCFRYEKKVAGYWHLLKMVYYKDATTDICQEIIKRILSNPNDTLPETIPNEEN